MLHQLSGFGVGGVMAVIVAASAGWFQDPASTPVQPVPVLAAAPAACAPVETPVASAAPTTTPALANNRPAPRAHRGTDKDQVVVDTVMAPVRYTVFRPDIAGLVPLSTAPHGRSGHAAHPRT